MRKRPKVIVDCAADNYHLPKERIIEFSFGGDWEGNDIGGLIAFDWLTDHPRLMIYRYSPRIEIVIGKNDE